MAGRGHDTGPLPFHSDASLCTSSFTVHTLLEATDDGQAPPLAELLAQAVDHMPAENRADLDAPDLAWAVAEVAVQVLVCTRTPLRPQEPNLAGCLPPLDRLPHAARTGLLAAATRRTTRRSDNAAPPTPRDPAPGRCPCPCNSGGFVAYGTCELTRATTAPISRRDPRPLRNPRPPLDSFHSVRVPRSTRRRKARTPRGR